MGNALYIIFIIWKGGKGLDGGYIPLMGYGPHEVDVLHEGDIPPIKACLPSIPFATTILVTPPLNTVATY